MDKAHVTGALRLLAKLVAEDVIDVTDAPDLFTVVAEFEDVYPTILTGGQVVLTLPSGDVISAI